MEEKGDILLDIMKQMSIKNIKILLAKAGKDIELRAKKEVFDDLDKLLPDWGAVYESQLEVLKKRHLSTFVKNKSNIIADKQNPQKKDSYPKRC